MKRTLLGSGLLLAVGTVLALGPAAAAQSPDRAPLPAVSAAGGLRTVPLAEPTGNQSQSPSQSPSPATQPPRRLLADSGVDITSDTIGVGGTIQSLYNQYAGALPAAAFVQGFVQHGGDLTGGHYNMLMVRSDAQFSMDFGTPRASATLRYGNGVRFNLWIFDQGSFSLHTDGGWSNWGFYGRFNRSGDSGRDVAFYRLPGGPVIGKDGKCVDVRNSGTGNGTPVQVYRCNNSNAQWWNRDGLALKAFGNKCLDANGASTGALVQLWDCNGTAPQQWYYEGGQLRNAQWGYCLDIPGGDTGDGRQLQMYQCNGTDAQRFSAPGD